MRTAIGDKHGEGIALYNMALLLHKSSERVQAITYAEEALCIFEQIDSRHTATVREQLAQWRGQAD